MSYFPKILRSTWCYLVFRILTVFRDFTGIFSGAQDFSENFRDFFWDYENFWRIFASIHDFLSTSLNFWLFSNVFRLSQDFSEIFGILGDPSRLLSIFQDFLPTFRNFLAIFLDFFGVFSKYLGFFWYFFGAFLGFF